LPDLPFAGFIQARCLLGLNKLQRWLDATWTPVGSKLKDDPRYQKEFLAPDDAAFVYFLVRGDPALGVAGRKRKQPTAPKVSFCATSVRCWCLKTPMLELNDCCPLRCIPSMHCSHGPSFQGISLHPTASRQATPPAARAPGQHEPPGGKEVRPFPSSPALFSPSPVAS
jgi:hypothetical protein